MGSCLKQRLLEINYMFYF